MKFVSGLYHTAEEAARAYDRKLREFYGRNASNTNFGSDSIANDICVEAASRNGTEVADMDALDKKKQPT